jgi:hypothetical protein
VKGLMKRKNENVKIKEKTKQGGREETQWGTKTVIYVCVGTNTMPACPSSKNVLEENWISGRWRYVDGKWTVGNVQKGEEADHLDSNFDLQVHQINMS